MGKEELIGLLQTGYSADAGIALSFVEDVPTGDIRFQRQFAGVKAAVAYWLEQKKKAEGAASGGSGQAGAGAGAAASARRIEMSIEQIAYQLPKLLDIMYMFTTPRSDTGEQIQKLQVSLVEHVLRGVSPLPMTPADLAKALAPTEGWFVYADAARREQDVQKAYNSITAALVALRGGGQVLHPCDTSTQGYPMYPCHKIDISVCTCEKPPTGRQVLWSVIVSAIELKCYATKDEADVLQQLHSRATAMFAMQPARKVSIGVAGDGQCIQVVRFERQPDGAIEVERTGWLSFELSAGSVGLLALARILLSAPEELGYVAPKSIHTFNVTVDGAEWSVTPQQLLQETGKRGDAAKASLVYSCHCNNSAGGQCEGVLKIGQMAEYEASVIRALNMAGRIAHIPILWHSGRLPDPVNYLIIQPRGSTIDFDVPTATLLTVVEDIANALDFLASQQVLHLDIAPNNIVLHEGRGMLVDFGIARQGGISSVDQGIGRVAFKSIDRLDVGKASLSGELESLFYTLSFWVCEGHLPWRNAVTTELALSMKWMAMTLRFEDLLRHCRPPDVPVLRRLHALFFPGSSKAGYRKDVRVAEFIHALRPTDVV